MPLHKTLTGTDLHEPKGVVTASSGHVYEADGAGSGAWVDNEHLGLAASNSNEVFIADGAGSGAWALANPHGGWRYEAIGTGTTFTAPTSNTLMNVVGVTTHLHEFTNNGLGRLTYTGTNNRHVHAVIDLTLKHSSGGGNDLFFEVYKNGAATGAVKAISADSANYYSLAMHYDVQMVTNDYIELFIKTPSGNIVIHEGYMFMMGMPS